MELAILLYLESIIFPSDLPQFQCFTLSKLYQNSSSYTPPVFIITFDEEINSLDRLLCFALHWIALLDRSLLYFLCLGYLFPFALDYLLSNSLQTFYCTMVLVPCVPFYLYLQSQYYIVSFAAQWFLLLPCSYSLHAAFTSCFGNHALVWSLLFADLNMSRSLS